MLITELKQKGKPWMGVKVPLMNALPDVIDSHEREEIAQKLVSRAMNEIFGEKGWKTEKREKKSGSGLTTWIVVVQEGEVVLR
jgi:hypothetical protein